MKHQGIPSTTGVDLANAQVATNGHPRSDTYDTLWCAQPGRLTRLRAPRSSPFGGPTARSGTSAGNRGVGGPGDRPSSYGSQTGAKAPFPESAPSPPSNGDRTVEASNCTTNSAKSKITVSQIATPGVR